MAETTLNSLSTSRSEVEFENKAYDEEIEKLDQECKELLLSLPREKGWAFPYLYLYQDIWLPPIQIQAIHSLQNHFQARDNDIVVASLPKSGTMWLKALAFAIVNRKCFPPSQHNHPLLISNAHELVRFFEFDHYANNQIPDLENLPEPRLFGTHIPFNLLPDSIIESKCKIIYICRNPFDNFVSLWFHLNKIAPPSLPRLSREEGFERYYSGIHVTGPFWTQVLGYWRASKETPNKVMFIKYEDLKGDANFCLKRMAEFLDCPFSSEEESNGVIENIIELCSFKKMKELEVNKTGKFLKVYDNKDLFRKGEVGDWVNHFNPLMTEKLSKLVEEKFGGSGLSF